VREEHYDTWAVINGNYWDDVTVRFEVEPAEPDVNWPGGLAINAVEVAGRNLLPEMTHIETEILVERVSEYLAECAECEE
jgi:hypothetical protein